PPYHYIKGPDPELYRLDHDPAESSNILRDDRRALGRMRQHLEAYEQSFAPPSEEDAETRAKLAALGYLGSTASSDADNLPDPKSQLATVEELKVAFEAYAQGHYQQAAEAFQAVLDKQPQLVDAWEQLGHARMAMGQTQAALEAFERAMELSGGSPPVAGAMASALLGLGQLEEAAQYAELAVDGHEQSRDVLAQIRIRQGDLGIAEPIVQEALVHRGSRLGPLLTAAELRFSQDRFQEALDLTDQLLVEFGDRIDWQSIRGVHYLRGSCFGRLQRLEEAVEAYAREAELFPAELEAFTSLAVVYTMQDDSQQARASLERMLEANPTAAAHAKAVQTLRRIGQPAVANSLLQDALRRWPQDAALRELG
ncbi:MAG: tetratricopeptide repeat protein, partial [Nitrospirae bacterium]|nr:tetratricopeptide repeat protein [Nitrospirota bacterium]